MFTSDPAGDIPIHEVPVFPPRRYLIGQMVSFSVRGAVMVGRVVAIEPRADATRTYVIATASGERFSVDEWSVGTLFA